ncbi:MAG TPA: helix-turn-helix transcriptional regulator [Chloroflexota bacterium]|jgi:transcriptional regulator with XRE-family HTH domain|nr:helix-turn-helix transcriptional regulator [Chloroflexota bacterium]
MALGAEIRQRRMALGVSLREFARRIGVSAPFLSDIEAGRRNPSGDVLARIAGELQAPLAELEAEDTRLQPEVRRWVESQPEVGRMLRTLKNSPRRDEMLRRMRRLLDEEGGA